MKIPASKGIEREIKKRIPTSKGIERERLKQIGNFSRQKKNQYVNEDTNVSNIC